MRTISSLQLGPNCIASLSILQLGSSASCAILLIFTLRKIPLVDQWIAAPPSDSNFRVLRLRTTILAASAVFSKADQQLKDICKAKVVASINVQSRRSRAALDHYPSTPFAATIHSLPLHAQRRHYRGPAAIALGATIAFGLGDR